MKSALSRLLLVVVLAGSVTGCAARARSVADIRNDPGQFDNRQVVVTGRVTSAWSVPLVPFGLYKIDDGSAEITVLSQQRGTPSKGALVKVRGNVRAGGQLRHLVRGPAHRGARPRPRQEMKG